MSGVSGVEVLTGWHAAVNAGDVEGAVAWCAEDVAVRGPRGVGRGQDLMRGWLVRSGIRLLPQDEFREVGGRYVVRELARWTTADAPVGAPVAEPVETWCVFTVAGGKLTSVGRYESPEDVPLT